MARERLRAFWNGSSLGRPALHITVRNKDAISRPYPWPESKEQLKALQLSPAFHAEMARRQLSNCWHLAEAFPAATVIYGSNLALLPVLTGGDYEVHGNVWIQEFREVLDRPLPCFDPGHPAITGLVCCLEQVASVTGTSGFVNPPILGLDALTCLSLFRSPEQLCIDMLERGDDVKAWCAAATEVNMAVCALFYETVRKLGYGNCSSWLSTMAEGRFEAVQCDFAVMISPELFGEFVIPDLERFCRVLDYSLYHLDGVEQLRFLPQLAQLPRLNGIQWNPQPGQKSALRWIDAFREIRRHGLCLQFNQGEVESVDEAVLIVKELGPDGLMIGLPVFDTVDEATDAIRRIEQAC